MCQCNLCLVCAFLCLCVYTVTTFNVDSFNYALYESPLYAGHSSMFGFSLALHKERNNGWLIVGAPEAQSNQPEVIHGGAVYKCPTTMDGGCEEIPFDTKGHNRDARNTLMDNKTEQWFGATVSSSGKEEGPIVACAPRYTWMPTPNNIKRRDPVGTCYVSNGFFADFNEYSPCRTYQWGYHRQGSCQAGFSAAINKVGDRLFIGSPGSWYWQGQMYSIDAHATFEFKPALFAATYGHEGQVHQQSLETRPAVFSTIEGLPNEDDSYMGYSTIAGDFLGNGEEGIAVGMPRGNDLKGKVLLFTWNLTNFMHHFTSDQIGSYYGYALAAADVDGDHKLDLIVGAPMYTVSNNKDKYDVGRVYVVYHQSEQGTFVANYVIDGFNSKSRFGQALASLGDINQDGYGDFAVGAPYDGKDNRGAVYIYHGSSKGVRKKFSQVIFAEDVIPSPTGALTTFGFSITGGMDLDGNEYPDMAVGAYLSNKAFFFRSRPVIRVDASVKFLSKTINIINTDHILKMDGSAASKTQIQFCSRYYGKGIPSSLNLGVEYILDTKKLLNPRMGFVDDEGQNRKNSTITLYRDQPVECAPPVDVYVRSDVRDKLTALVVEAKYWLKQDVDLIPMGFETRPRNPKSILTPVLDLNSPPSKKDSINIHRNCGDDNVCIPNLDLTVEPSVQEFYLDAGKNFFLDITVSNTGEDAFESTLDLHYPDGFFYATSTDVQVVSHVLCSSGENNTIKCDIGNPIPFNGIVHFKLEFQPDYSKELPSKLHFDVFVNSTNEEPVEFRQNNKRRVEISILYDVIQDVHGRSIPGEVLFSPASALYTEDISNQTIHTATGDRLSEEVIGPQVIHVYELKNRGKTKIKATEIFFVWPSTTSTGEDFLYLVDPPHFSFTENLNLKCGPIPANYRDFELSLRRKTIWELYDIAVQAYTSDEITSTKNETSIKNDTSKPIKATIGGKLGKNDTTLDRKVDKNIDIKDVLKYRQNKTQTTRVQIFESRQDLNEKLGGNNFKRVKFEGRDYIYRCLKTENGREVEVDCGADFSFSTRPGLLQAAGAQFQEEGNIHYWCLEQDDEGNWKKVVCEGAPRVPVVVRKEGTTTVQIFRGDRTISGQLGGGGSYQYQTTGKGNFVYRCFRRRNGREEEVDCGKKISLSSIDIPWVLEKSGVQQQEGNLKYACLELDSQGRLQRTTCQDVPKIKITTEVVRTSWGENNTHYWDNTGVYFRFSKIQVFEGDEELRRQLEGGLYNIQYVDGRYFIYRCFQNDREVDCQGFSLAGLNILRLLQSNGIQQDEKIKYTCLEPNGRYISCGSIPPIRIKAYFHFSKIQVFQGDEKLRSQLEGGIYRHQYIDGRDFIYRCFRDNEEVDCGQDFSLARLNVRGLLERTTEQDDRLRYTCLEPNGRYIPCGSVPKIRFKTIVTTSFWKSNVTHYWNDTGVYRLPQTYNFESVQILQGGQDIVTQLTGNYGFERVENQDFFFRCFRDAHQVDCGPNLSLAGINIFVLMRGISIQRVGNIQYFCLEFHNQEWRGTDCEGLPRIEPSQQQSVIQTQQQILRRCLKLVQNAWEIVDCHAGAAEVNSGGTFVEQCFQTVDGRPEQIDCKRLPLGTVFSDMRTDAQYNQNRVDTTSPRSNPYGGYGSANYRTNNTRTYDSYEDEDVFEDEYNDGKTVSGYLDPQAPPRETQQGRRDPKTYGRYDESSNQGGIEGLGQGRGFTTGVLDLGNLGGNNRGSRSHWSETAHRDFSYNNVGDNVPTSSPSSKSWHHGRRKRQIVTDSHPSIAKIRKDYPCKNLGCIYMRCTIENLEHDKPLTIALRGRLNAKVLREMKLDNSMQFSSMMLARVHKVPNLMSIEDSKITVREVETVVKIPEEIKSETVPLWVVVLSAVAGTIILLLLIFLLYKLGFFKRNRPSTAPERQPLNRNGYHHGDEAL